MTKHLSYRSESLMNLLANRLLKTEHISWHEGKPWTGLSLKSLSKLMKCTIRCAEVHINKLVSEGALLKAQLRIKELDRTNYYCINPKVLDNAKLTSFFNRSITNKIATIYNIKKSLINQNKSIARERVCNADMAKQPKKAAANPVMKEQAKRKIAFESEKDVTPSPAKRVTTAEDMLRVWNEELGREDELSKPLARYLVASYQRKFDCSLPKWKEYVFSLRRSTYVMGKLLKKLGKYLLKWALSFKVINKIFAGGFGCGMDANTCEKATLPGNSADEHIASLSESESCKEVRRVVVETYGENAYLSWFRQVELVERDGEMLIRGSGFVVEAIKLRYLQGRRFIEDPVYEPIEASSDKLPGYEYVGASRVATALFGR